MLPPLQQLVHGPVCVHVQWCLFLSRSFLTLLVAIAIRVLTKQKTLDQPRKDTKRVDTHYRTRTVFCHPEKQPLQKTQEEAKKSWNSVHAKIRVVVAVVLEEIARDCELH